LLDAIPQRCISVLETINSVVAGGFTHEISHKPVSIYKNDIWNQDLKGTTYSYTRPVPQRIKEPERSQKQYG
jgi:hypothetical protein